MQRSRRPVGGEAFPGGPTYRRYEDPASFDDGRLPGGGLGEAKDNSGAKYSAPEEVFSTDLEKQARKGGAIWELCLTRLVVMIPPS